MGLIGTLLDFVRGTTDNAEVADVTIDPGGGANLTAQHYAGAGDDSRPLAGDYVVAVEGPGAGNAIAVGYLDPNNAGETEPGEKRIYARGGDGVKVGEVWLKADGSLELRNDNGSMVLGADGNVSVSGNLSVDGEVTARAGNPATAVGLSTHLHPTAMGPSDAPTPGT